RRHAGGGWAGRGGPGAARQRRLSPASAPGWGSSGPSRGSALPLRASDRLEENFNWRGPGVAPIRGHARGASHDLVLLLDDHARELRARGGGGDRLDETARVDGELLGAGRHPGPGDGTASTT